MFMYSYFFNLCMSKSIRVCTEIIPTSKPAATQLFFSTGTRMYWRLWPDTALQRLRLIHN